MKRNAFILAIGMLLATALWGATGITSVAITNSTVAGSAITTSTIDSTPIGVTTPAVGSITPLTIGAMGTPVNQLVYGQVSITVPATNVGACHMVDTAFNGANMDAAVFVNMTSATGITLGPINTYQEAWVATPNVVTISFCNTTTAASLDYGGGTLAFNLLVVQ